MLSTIETNFKVKQNSINSNEKHLINASEKISLLSRYFKERKYCFRIKIYFRTESDDMIYVFLVLTRIVNEQKETYVLIYGTDVKKRHSSQFADKNEE